MQVVSGIPELRAARAGLPDPLGLVPTMGYLHEGHLSLVRAARDECASVAVSIFVNPTQFGPAEDLDAYPRNLQRDLDLLQNEGVDLVWTPTAQIMYPSGYQTWVTVEDLSAPLEGAQRPDHFRGVTTVVAKLFNAVAPQRAYFGQKDAQQAIVLKRMTADLNFPIEVIVKPIVREPDGLAMSSRNAYLDPAQRKAAVVLSQALWAAQQAFADGLYIADGLREVMARTIAAEPLARMQYVSCADPRTLQEIQGEVADKALLSMAVYIGETRLIDNLILER